MAAESSQAPVNPRPLFSDANIDYLKIIAGEGEDQHVFIIDKDAAVKYSSTVRDMLSIGAELPTGTSDDSSIPELEFRDYPMKSIEVAIQFFYWKKRWANVVVERIPDFPLPTDKNVALNTLVVANELQC
jgi:hypothetical protein